MTVQAQLEPLRFAVDFVVTPPVVSPILGDGCLQDLGLLWDHRLNEVVVEGVHHRLRNLPTDRMSTRRIILQRDVVLPARCISVPPSRRKGRGPQPLVRTVQE